MLPQGNIPCGQISGYRSARLLLYRWRDNGQSNRSPPRPGCDRSSLRRYRPGAMDDLYSALYLGKNDPLPEAQSERGLSRPRRWRDSALPWKHEAVQAAIDRRDVETVIRHLLYVLPTYVADALAMAGVPPVDDKGTQAQHRIEEGVSRVIWEIVRNLSEVLTRSAAELKVYYRLRSRSLIRKMYKGTRCCPFPDNSGPADPQLPPRYREATHVLAELAMQLASTDLHPLLVDILAGRAIRLAVRDEAKRREGRPGFPKTIEARQAGVWRDLATLGAMVAAAAPDWALVAWGERWGGWLAAA